MKRIDEDAMFAAGENLMLGMIDTICDPAILALNELKPEETILIVVDMVNGFAKEGVLSSPRINELIQPISEFVARCNEKGIKTLAFEDGHAAESTELNDRPTHCLLGTAESKTVDEIKAAGIETYIKKNSTNGVMTTEFYRWLTLHGRIRYKNFIIVGCCTDICISQLALTIKAYFNQNNLDRRVVVPRALVDTYDAPGHNADLMNMFSLYQMIDNGIEVVAEIE